MEIICGNGMFIYITKMIYLMQAGNQAIYLALITPKVLIYYYLKTKYLTKESTKSRPCMKHKPTTCKEVEMHKKIEQLYSCTIPIYYTGQHLDEYIHWLHPCNKKKMASLIFENFNCYNWIPCKQTHQYINKVGGILVKERNSQHIKGCRFEYNLNKLLFLEVGYKL